MATVEDSNVKPMQVDVDSASKYTETPTKPFCRKRNYLFADTKCCCCCCCLLTGVLSFILFLVVLFANASAQTFPATRFTNIEYKSLDGVTTLHAYLATPTTPLPNTPAVILFHAWNGMGEEVTYFADQLAEQGYYAIAPDLFRNVAAEPMNILHNIMNVISTPQPRMDSDSDAALTYLKSIANVDASRISSGPGFCFGGTQSLMFATRHTMAAAVTCYGTYASEFHQVDGGKESPAWGKLTGGTKVLGIYGELDTAPAPEVALGFEKALVKKGMVHNITIYPDVGHAFINPESYKDEEAIGHSQAKGAWQEIVTFLNMAFDNTTSVSGKRRELELDVVAKESIIPWNVAFKHRIKCAWKCAKDHFTKTGHGERMQLK